MQNNNKCRLYRTFKPELEKCKGTWKGLGIGHRLGSRQGLKDTARGQRPLIVTHKVPGCLQHSINIKGNGWLRLSLGTVEVLVNEGSVGHLQCADSATSTPMLESLSRLRKHQSHPDLGVAEQKLTLASTKACTAEVNTFSPEVRGPALPGGSTCFLVFKAICSLLLGAPLSINSSGKEPIKERRSRKKFQPKPILRALSPASQMNKYMEQSSGRQARAAGTEGRPPAVRLATSCFERNRRCQRAAEGLGEGQGFGEKVFFLPLTSSRFRGGTGLEAVTYAMSSSILTICLCQ